MEGAAMSEPTDRELLVQLMTRIDDKLTDVLSRLGKLESGHEQIAALHGAQLRQMDKITDHEIRLTKIETKGGIITAGIAVVISLTVALITASYKQIIGG